MLYKVHNALKVLYKLVRYFIREYDSRRQTVKIVCRFFFFMLPVIKFYQHNRFAIKTIAFLRFFLATSFHFVANV